MCNAALAPGLVPVVAGVNMTLDLVGFPPSAWTPTQAMVLMQTLADLITTAPDVDTDDIRITGVGPAADRPTAHRRLLEGDVHADASAAMWSAAVWPSHRLTSSRSVLSILSGILSWMYTLLIPTAIDGA